jgi:hypothetical protein
MNQEKQEPSQIMIDTFISKFQNQDQRILAQDEKLVQLEKDVKAIPDHSKDLAEIKTSNREQATLSSRQKAMMEQLDVFFKKLGIAIDVLKSPVINTVQHHHHFPKIAWVTTGLFLALCLVCSGWYVTARSSEQYQANDIKYRKLKLLSDSAALEGLYGLDSLYLADPEKMEKEVKEQEQLKQERLELLDKIQAVNRKIRPDTKTGQQPKKASNSPIKPS